MLVFLKYFKMLKNNPRDFSHMYSNGAYSKSRCLNTQHRLELEVTLIQSNMHIKNKPRQKKTYLPIKRFDSFKDFCIQTTIKNNSLWLSVFKQNLANKLGNCPLCHTLTQNLCSPCPTFWPTEDSRFQSGFKTNAHISTHIPKHVRNF